MIALLAEADFRRVWLVGAIAGALRWLELLAIGVYVLQQTGSPSLVAFITALRLAPMFVCGSLIGALGDRYERSRVLLICLAIVGATSVVLGALAFAGRITLWQIALGTVVSGGMAAADMTLRRIISAEIAGTARIGQAMALDSVNSNATRMLGPALGGFLLETLGLYGVYLLGALLYLAGMLLILRTRYRPERAAGAGSAILGALREGWRYVRARRVIVGVLAVTIVANFWGFAYITMVPVIGERVLGLSAFPIGVLLSIQGLGALLGALAVVRTCERRSYARVFLGCTFFSLVAVLGFGLSRWYPLSLLLNLAWGVSVGGFSVLQSSILILAARPEVRSRVMGVLAVAVGAGQLGGMLHVGLLADWLGAAAAVRLMAVEGLLALAATAVLWPEMRRAGELPAGTAEADD
ncbi:MAG TPA: MFS transporter [Geminicoccaceae bacterium]|nr:MFS transporter [Geminicoccaceae bacterium]